MARFKMLLLWFFKLYFGIGVFYMHQNYKTVVQLLENQVLLMMTATIMRVMTVLVW